MLPKTFATFTFDSTPGDYIGQGSNQSYELSNTTFTVRETGVNAVRFSLERSGDNWNIEFAAPKGKRLRVGSYPNATRCAFHADNEPGLTMSGNGRGSNESFGEFTIYKIRFNKSGKLVLFSGKFTQHNERPEAPALRGELNYCLNTKTGVNEAAA